MKIVSAVAKVLAALTAVVGAIYLLATYGEQIVAWCKKVMANLPTCPCCDEAEEPVVEEPVVEEPVVEDPAEEAEEVLEEVPVEEIPVEESVAENEVVADDADFAE